MEKELDFMEGIRGNGDGRGPEQTVKCGDRQKKGR